MAIELRNLVKRYGARLALNNVSLTIHDGQFVSLLGPSGSGKTTLLQAIAGLTSIDSGEIVVDGGSWSSSAAVLPSDKRNVGMVFQDLALWPHMNVFQNIAFGLRIKGRRPVEIRDRVDHVLRLVDMVEYRNSLVHQLSGGQRQRVAVARAMALSPRLILMDEPLSALDAKLRERMRWELREMMHRAGMTTLYVTHDQMEALSMSDHVVLLNQGEVVQSGAPQALYHQPANRFAADFLGGSNIIRCRVEDTVGERVELSWQGMALAAHTQHDPMPGSTLDVMLRPHTLSLSSPSAARESVDFAWQGRIESCVFQGSHWLYRVRLTQNGESVEVAQNETFGVQDEVIVWGPAGSARILDDERSPIASGKVRAL